MQKRWVKYSVVGASVLIAAAATYGQKITTKTDGDYNFAAHKSYMWKKNYLMTRQNPDTNEVLNLKIVKAVNQELASKGFVEVKEKPDFYVYYDGGGSANIRSGGASDADPGPTTTADTNPGFGLTDGPAVSPNTWMKVNGQIVFYAVPAGAPKPVWQATCTKTFRDPDKALKDMDKEVSQWVSKSFKDFPPKNK
ncbi:MAG TPA: DUF4136 domain-containing protein [Methylomirabilota bacterium]|nr:DUF4136 domain-containing protein [Methylomirabilota bacterium]